jgi:caspase domain-containing protein
LAPGGQLRTGTKRLALLAATDRFDDPNLPPLFGREEQIIRVARLLENTGAFEVSLLLGRELTSNNLRRQFLSLSDKANQDDCLLFYFAGHAGFVYDEVLRLVVVES